MRFLSSVSIAAAAFGLTEALPKSRVMKRSAAPEQVNGKFIVDRQAEFDHSLTFTFESGSLPQGLIASNYELGAGTHRYTPDNVNVRDGYLELLVPGGQTSMPYACGEINTEVSNILYASVRTVAILTEPAGVCNGMFFYQSDTQETDIEWLSDPNSTSNGGSRKIWFTNQDANGDGESTHSTIDPPADVTSAEHEYRLDWTEGRVQWFLDGEQVWETNQDVPSVPGPWLWNNWANGEPGWSVGPPAEDAVFKIKQIEMYYNTA